jgi:hypothetical protein
MPERSASLLLLTLLAVLPGGVAAQCDGKVISAIAITTHVPSFLHVPRTLRPLARAVGLEHTTTRADVVRTFLLMNVGQPCRNIELAESERILRLQPFLAEATIRAVPDSAGAGVRVEITTFDEIPTIFSLRLRDGGPAAIRFGNGNVAGRALSVSASVERGFHYRTGVGAQVVAYQAFGRPNTFAFVADRAPLGSTLTLALGHAFFTDLQRTAWHLGFSSVNAYASFTRPDTTGLSLSVVRRFADIGGVRRIGLGQRIGFLGGLLTYERVAPAAQAVVVTDSGLVADTSAPLGGPFPRYQNVRFNAVVGVRHLSFLAARGFDALAAVQDVARGVQVGMVAGQGNDSFLSADFYSGLGSARSFAALRVSGEARHDPGARRWDGVVVSGRVAWYWRPADAHTVITSTEYSGGWRTRVPFQLSLGALAGGVRGYRNSRVVGAVRSVTRVEDRWALGRLGRHVGLGLASFVDAGAVWPGDAPFGVRSGMKTGVGAGLLVAVPPASKRLWRLDLAVPLSADSHARWEIRLTTVWVSGFWSEPRDVAQARAGAAPSLIFTWP